jgi:hypothetical protein
VTAIDRAEGRLLIDGRLGCHVCGAQFPLEGGVAAFGAPQPREVAAAADVGVAPADPWRIAALLDLSASAGVVVLQGSAAAASAALLDMLPVMILAVNPAVPLPTRERFGVVSTSSGLPLRTGIAAGIALSDAALVTDAMRVLRPGGRLVAPAASESVPGLEELARDEREWVAVKRSGEVIRLTRR